MNSFVMDTKQIKGINKKVTAEVGDKRYSYKFVMLSPKTVYADCGCGAGGTCASSCVSGCAERGSCCSFGPK